jgi:hypothetical protein
LSRAVAKLRHDSGIDDRMPFKSQAQRRKFAQLLVEGKISNETFEEWNRETGGQKLPERVTRAPAGTKAKSRKATRRAKKKSATKKSAKSRRR